VPKATLSAASTLSGDPIYWASERLEATVESEIEACERQAV